MRILNTELSHPVSKNEKPFLFYRDSSPQEKSRHIRCTSAELAPA